MTSPPGLSAPILTTLTSELRLLPTVPAWAEVERGLRELRATHANALSVANREAVKYAVWSRDFADLLLRCQDSIANALICAAAIGAAAPPSDSAEKLTAGLRAMSSALGFRRLTEAQLDATLKALRTALAVSYPADRLDATVSKVEKAPEVEGWGKEIADIIARARQSITISKPALRLARDRAWDDWEKNRIESYLRRQAQTLTADDLLTCAARMPPGAILKAHPEDVTMCDWSSLLAHAFADEGPESDSFAPEWIAAPALAALGFGLRADLIGAWIDDRRWSKRRPDRQRLDSWIARLTRPEPRPGAFVLRRDTTSLLGAWPVSNAAPVLALTHRDAIRLAGSRPESLSVFLKHLDVGVVAVEMPVDEPAEALVRALADRGQGAVTFLHLYPPGTTSPKQPALVGPRGPEELMPRAAPPENRAGSLA